MEYNLTSTNNTNTLYGICPRQRNNVWAVSSSGASETDFQVPIALSDLLVSQDNRKFFQITFITFEGFSAAFGFYSILTQQINAQTTYRSTEYTKYRENIDFVGVRKTQVHRQWNGIPDISTGRSENVNLAICTSQKMRERNHNEFLTYPITLSFCNFQQNKKYINPLGPNKYFAAPPSARDCLYNGQDAEDRNYEFYLDLNSEDVVLEQYDIIENSFDFNSAVMDGTDLCVVIDYDDLFGF